ncbi:MAG: biopolymer transporter ExbD [Myxococcales bacterium]|nr:biopolymer transporter ExbD [Myxococcales bacterium]
MKSKRHHLGPKRASSLSSAPMRSEINVTPLVDVVLVLLIIFMVVTPMISRGVKVTLPETLHHTKKQDTGEQIVVGVTKDGKAYVGVDRADGDALITLLRKEMGGNSSREVHVKADRDLEYGQVREILERIHAAGAAKVSLGTEDKREGGKK